MTIFLDTSFIIAVLNKKDKRNEKATIILKRILNNEWGRVTTSDYIVDECYTLIISRTKNIEILTALYDFVHGNSKKNIPNFIEFKEISPDLYFDSWRLSKKYKSVGLSFTDLTNLAICEKFKIFFIASFDADFDGKLTRIF